MAMTYRKEKVDAYVRRLKVRKEVLTNQLHQQSYANQEEFMKGQLAAIELVIEEIMNEFT